MYAPPITARTTVDDLQSSLHCGAAAITVLACAQTYFREEPGVRAYFGNVLLGCCVDSTTRLQVPALPSEAQLCNPTLAT